MPEPIRALRPEKPDIKEQLKSDLEQAKRVYEAATEEYERAVQDCERLTRESTARFGPKHSISQAVQSQHRALLGYTNALKAFNSYVLYKEVPDPEK